MILLLAPGPNMTFGAAPSGASYVSDPFGLIKIANDSTGDQAYLQGAGCYTLSAFGGWGTFGFETLAELYGADAASGLVLPGRLGFPKFTLCDVTDDGGNTGSWLKTGSGAGSGNWTKKSSTTSIMAATSAAAAQAWAQGTLPGGAGTYSAKEWAEQAGDLAEAGSAISSALVAGMDDAPLIESYEHGNPIVPSSSTGLANGILWHDDPLPFPGTAKAIKALAKTAGPAEVHFSSQDENGDRVYQGKVTLTVATTGSAQEYDVLSQGVKVKAGWYPGWKSGARLAVQADPITLFTANVQTDDTPVTPGYISNSPSFSVVIQRDTIVDEGRVKSELDRVPLGRGDGIHNLNAANTRRSRAAVSAIRAGMALSFFASLFLWAGDSNFGGSHTGTDGLYLGAFDRSVVGQTAAGLAGLMADDGIDLPVAYKGQAIIGLQNVQGAYTAFNSACLSEGTFTQTGIDPGYVSIGGEMWVSAAPGGDPIIFNIDATADRLLLGYPRRSSAGSIEYSLNGGLTWTELNQYSEADEYHIEEIAFPRGTVSQTRIRHKDATSTVRLHAHIAHDSTTPEIRFLNGAGAGSLASTTWGSVFTNPWSPITLLRNIEAAAKIIGLGTNDIANGVALSTYLSAMRRLIRAGLAKSDVFVACFPPLPIDTGNKTLERQLAFRAGLFALCEELNVPFIDTWAYFGDHPTAYAAGYMSSDVHTTYAGSGLWSLIFRDLFSRL